VLHTEVHVHRCAIDFLTGIGSAGMAIMGWGFASGSVSLLMLGSLSAGIAYGALQSVTLDLSFSRVPGAQAPVASATWNAFFDAGTATGAAVFAAVAATSLGGRGAMTLGGLFLLLVGAASLRSALAPTLARRAE